MSSFVLEFCLILYFVVGICLLISKYWSRLSTAKQSITLELCFLVTASALLLYSGNKIFLKKRFLTLFRETKLLEVKSKSLVLYLFSKVLVCRHLVVIVAFKLFLSELKGGREPATDFSLRLLLSFGFFVSFILLGFKFFGAPLNFFIFLHVMLVEIELLG